MESCGDLFDVTHNNAIYYTAPMVSSHHSSLPPPPIPKKAIKSIRATRAIRLVMGQGAQSYLARGKILHHQIQFQVSKKEHRKCPCHSIPTPFIYFEYEHGCTKKESCGL
jgi:hypothetical protein